MHVTAHARTRHADARAVLALLAALTLGFLALTAQPVAAATVDDCQTQLADLHAATQAASPSFTNERDATGLSAKVAAASADLTAGKNVGAVLKLGDFQAKLSGLASAPKPKVDPAVAESLSTQAQLAIDCIQSLE